MYFGNHKKESKSSNSFFVLLYKNNDRSHLHTGKLSTLQTKCRWSGRLCKVCGNVGAIRRRWTVYVTYIKHIFNTKHIVRYMDVQGDKYQIRVCSRFDRQHVEHKRVHPCWKLRHACEIIPRMNAYSIPNSNFNITPTKRDDAPYSTLKLVKHCHC